MPVMPYLQKRLPNLRAMTSARAAQESRTSSGNYPAAPEI